MYIAGTSAGFYVLNSEFKMISTIYSPDRVSGENIGQGVSCDDDYIYFVLSAGTLKTEIIEVYDWSGKLVTKVEMDIEPTSEHNGSPFYDVVIESENISVVGDKIYIMVAEYTETISPKEIIDKPANVYVIDLSKTQ